MSKSNGKADLRVEEREKQNVEPELPPADPNDGFVEQAATPSQAAAEQPQPAEELQKLRSERDALLDRLARLQAEFDNYRKRVARENTEFRDYALVDTVRQLLPVVDHFSLAIKNADANPQEFRKGVELIYKQLQEVLQKIGVQRIAAEGQPFDPRFHEAIEVVDSNQVQDNFVLEELQPGYKIKDRLLRPAMVRVARNKQG